MSLSSPLDIALIGTGNRSQQIYRPLFASLRPWVRLVAVCDPVREHADAYAESMGVPAFYSIHDLVRARPMEAALVVAPIESHYPLSCYLSQHGIHNLVETSMCSLLTQAHEMVRTARDNRVVLRVAENFFRFPFDRIAKKIADTGFLGAIKRLTCFHDHTGYHNNSRWIKFYGGHPVSVQAIEHTMPVAPHYEAPHRFHTQETFRARFFTFSDNRLGVDLAGNIKGLLGRYSRPGYTEIDGQRGAIVRQATQPWHGEAEVRYCSDEALQNGGVADHIFPIVHVSEAGCWASTYVDLPIGRVEYVNPHRPAQTPSSHARRDYYAAAVMGHIIDFACAVREGTQGVPASEYTEEDALIAMMMEVAAHESALRNGERLDLPLAGDLETEQQVRKSLKAKYGVDPLDIEGMLGLSLPRP
jgi:predicted dehydrogenase